MKKILIITALLLGVVGLSIGQIAQTSSYVNLRSSPYVGNNVIKVLAKNKNVKLVGCKDNWCKVISGFDDGYVYISYLKTVENPDTEISLPEPEIKYYYNVDEIKVQSPTYYKKAPRGASAVCKDGTYSFSRNRRGTCSRHGGVKKWLN